jgi:phosphate/sulfate permease
LSLIVISIVAFFLTYSFMVEDLEKWKTLWNIRISVLFIALLSILYAGFYFATKNYEMEKELEYKNKIRSNIANTWLTFSAGQNESTMDIVTKEAAKTLFADITLSERGKNSENRNISISIPQNIGKELSN